ncbi:MAG: 23S rRNA (pseudouridine(1915)-N(3))-methyltransferase RlmH [Desulfarculaceae bacterium]|nr:23S rRNA (pseudouridine(1915)-N(3))-methyltransferase RlmH [Desulfarculaceae bacterium]MCF8072061.1 23S rRNA (pseudouridine(1915)-N(3))-methyltransferase RlmH [Desulfarculaceae bacterium]MCF8101578.1 23S rRNA (pseudouridine(1915)-N(3))-methyltransferase RlmH [Desulfarculaceae bacterium]MCF8115128.1 23S rRNA (pseudouridine(1915)-N(3))-methyltransferase RlmH [Desulfarculaceae bacterium]
MKHLLLTVGKPKAAYLAEGMDDYLARLKPYGGGARAAVRQAKPGKNRAGAEVMAEEAQRLLARLEPRDLVWALDRKGKAWSSGQWAKNLEQARMSGKSRLVLVVGGPLGLDPTVLARAEARVSFGPPTMAHELAALVATEQLYRASTILAGLPYHRA